MTELFMVLALCAVGYAVYRIATRVRNGGRGTGGGTGSDWKQK
jgi:hypothetical protein